MMSVIMWKVEKMKNSKKLCKVTFFLFVISLVSSLFADLEAASKPSKAEIFEKAQNLQIPFIANEGSRRSGEK